MSTVTATAVEAATIPELFSWRASRNPDTVAVRFKRNGEFVGVSWSQLQEDVWRAADVLVQLGIQFGDRVVQVAGNRYEWIVNDLAILSLGAVHVPLHSTLNPAQHLAQATDSQPSCLIHAERESFMLDGIPTLCLEPDSRPNVLLWSESMASADPQRGRTAGEAALPRISASTLATLLYTSGTTGDSKGVMLTHGNVTSNALATNDVFSIGEDKIRVNFLPMSHIFARGCDIYGWLAGGCQLVLADSKDTVIADCQAVGPHFIAGVPYFFERVMRTLHSMGVADKPGVLRKTLGGRIELCCAGGAPLADETFDYFWSQDVPLLQGYGLTETSPVISMSTVAAHRRGAVGQILPGVEVRIESDGEISTRGPLVMQGYWHKPEATAEVLTQDGWFHTGDLGKLDDDGYLWITGRKKELIVTAGGKNIAPVLIEMLVNQDPLIAQSLVVGDRKAYLVALIVPDLDQLNPRLAASGLTADSWQGAELHPTVRQWYEEAMTQRLAGLSRYEQIQKFVLLTRPFTIEGGELTAKLSLRRSVIVSMYQDQIRSLYGS